MSVFYRMPIEDAENLRKEKKVKNFNNKLVCFDYYTKKYMKDKKNFQIIGTLEKKTLKKGELDKIDEDETSSDLFFAFSETDRYVYEVSKNTTKGVTVGYICVGDDQYIRIAKRPTALLLLLIPILCVSFFFLINTASPDIFSPKTEGVDSSGDIKNGKISQAGQGEIEMVGYSEISVSSKNPTVELVNPSSNDVYFKYIIKDKKEGETVFESELIQPGKAYLWDVKSALSTGKYTLDFYIQTFDVETLSNCEGACIKNVIVKVR